MVCTFLWTVLSPMLAYFSLTAVQPHHSMFEKSLSLVSLAWVQNVGETQPPSKIHWFIRLKWRAQSLKHLNLVKQFHYYFNFNIQYHQQIYLSSHITSVGDISQSSAKYKNSHEHKNYNLQFFGKNTSWQKCSKSMLMCHSVVCTFHLTLWEGVMNMSLSSFGWINSSCFKTISWVIIH